MHLLNDAVLLLGPCCPGQSLAHEWWGNVNVTAVLLSVCCVETGTGFWSLLTDILYRFLLLLTAISLLRKIILSFFALKTLCSYHNLVRIFHVQYKFDCWNTSFSHGFNEDQCCLKIRLYVSIAHIFINWDLYCSQTVDM